MIPNYAKNNKFLLAAMMALVSILMISPHPGFADESNIEVVVEGIGSSPETATKNAIEQALMQAVGRLIDTETIIKKKTEIENEMRSVSKTIDQSMLEYSQGVIDAYQQVSIRQENGIYRVTALVQVRSKELAPLLNGVVYGSADIDGSLFSTFQVENDQQADRLTMVIDKIFKPMLDWTAYELTVEQPMLVKKKPIAFVTEMVNRRLETEPYFQQRVEWRIERAIERDSMYDDRFVITLPYTLRLTEAFKSQASDLLERVADRQEFNAQKCNDGNDKHLEIILTTEFNAKCYILDDSAQTFWGHQDLKELVKNAKFNIQLFDQTKSKILEAVSGGENIPALGDGVHTNCTATYSYRCKSKQLAFHNVGYPPMEQQAHLYGKNDLVLYTHPKQRRFWVLEELQGVLLLGMQEQLAKRTANVTFGLQ